jgi:hypothetical protein
VEGTHRQLRARLADRLRGDHADRLADVDQRTAAEVAAVALGAQAVAGVAGQRRAHLDFVDAQRSIRSTMSSSSSVPASIQVSCVSGSTRSIGDTAEDALAQRLDHFTALDQRLHRTPFSVPQSSSMTTRSCVTSTRRRVR